MSDRDYPKSIDDPQNLNAFLTMIGGNLIPESPQVKHDSAAKVQICNEVEPVNTSATHEQKMIRNEFIPHRDDIHSSSNSGASTPQVETRVPSVASSPATAGINAPPPTPATRGLNPDAAHILPPIEEDGSEILSRLADQSDLRLEDSRHARRAVDRRLADLDPSLDTPTKNFDSLSLSMRNRKMSLTPTQAKEVEELASLEDVRSFEQSVISAFRRKNSHLEGQHKEDCQQIEPVPVAAAVNDSKERTRDKSEMNPCPSLHDLPVPTTEPESSPVSLVSSHIKISQDTRSPQTAALDAKDVTPMKPANVPILHEKSGNLTKQKEDRTELDLLQAKAKLASKVASQSQTREEEMYEDRENLTHFKTWGPPAARNKPGMSGILISDVYRLTIERLPRPQGDLVEPAQGADLTLVQSLISGGAIDTLILSASGEKAYVTFTAGDACDQFHDKYPNGISFKYRGKNHVVFVDKAQDVDVVSGILQGQLDCGASRCVRAVGADEDWGIKALHRLAEGAKGSRKIENIVDNYRNQVRTIVFRFASIADAVQFKKSLARDEDWEACNIQFMEDPCDKATDVHLE